MALLGQDEWLPIVNFLSVFQPIPDDTPLHFTSFNERPQLIDIEDKKALECLASVCTVLRSMVLPILFRHIVLESPKAIEIIGSIPSFRERVPITSLELTWNGPYDRRDLAVELSSAAFIDFISRCKHLESLYLSEFTVDYERWDSSIDRMKKRMAFANLTTLVCGRAESTKMPFRYFRQLVSLMPMLKYLSCMSVADDEASVESKVPPFHLEALVVFDDWGTNLECYAWLLSNSKTTLCALEMILIDDMGGGVYPDLMKALSNGVGQSLRCLRLWGVDFQEAQMRGILEKCVNLEELDIDPNLEDGVIMSYLEVLRKPLQRLILSSVPTYIFQDCRPVYEILATALQQNHPKLVDLQSIKFRFRWDNEDNFRVASSTLQQACEARKVQFIEYSRTKRA